MYMAIPKSCLPNRRYGFGLLLRWFSSNLELDIILMSLESFYCTFIEHSLIIHNEADLHFDFRYSFIYAPLQIPWVFFLFSCLAKVFPDYPSNSGHWNRPKILTKHIKSRTCTVNTNNFCTLKVEISAWDLLTCGCGFLGSHSGSSSTGRGSSSSSHWSYRRSKSASLKMEMLK